MTYPARIVVWLVRVYQRSVSRLLGSRCRFYPSCSEYLGQAVERHGTARGAYLGARRVLRCHPFNPGGVDHVPTQFFLRRPHVAREGSPRREDVTPMRIEA